MKYLIATIILICGIALSSCIAQGPGPGVQSPGPGPAVQGPGPGVQGPPDGSTLESYKIAYLSQRMNLSPEEGQRFWPIYNQYTAEMRQVQLSFRNNRDEISREDAVLNIRKKYNFLFSRALPREKVNMFFHTEREFNNFVQREMQRRQLRMQQPRRYPQLAPRRFGN
jgi:hypothetical protein